MGAFEGGGGGVDTPMHTMGGGMKIIAGSYKQIPLETQNQTKETFS